MIKDKFSYLIELCLEVQRGKDGNIESRKSRKASRLDDSVKGPTVFFSFLDTRLSWRYRFTKKDGHILQNTTENSNFI